MTAEALPGTGDSWIGRHSNIPRCCIRFYIEQWAVRPLLRDPHFERNYWRRMRRRQWTGLYIPCPRCLASGRAVKIHLCGPRCGVMGSRERPLWFGFHRWIDSQRKKV